MRLLSQAITAVFSSLFVSAAIAAPLSKPLVPVKFRVNMSGSNDYTTSELDVMAKQSQGLWGNESVLPTGSDLSYLRSKNAGYTVIAYVNGGHQGAWPDDAEQLEDDRLDYIQVYRATTLHVNIDKNATQIQGDDITDIPITGGAVDPRTAVRSLDGRTGSNGGFISFVRIGNEIMRVTGKTGTNPNKLIVIRGTDGTAAASHSAGDPILAPVYVHDYNPDGPEAIDSGSVRYSLNVGTPQLAQLLTSVFIDGFMRDGYDGAWLDITSPSFYNMVDAENAEIDGETRFPYNTVAKADYTLSTRANHHDLKIGRIQSAIQDEFGVIPVLNANNNADGKWFGDGAGYGRRFAMDNNSKLQPIDGVSLEGVFVSYADAPPYYSYDGFSVWKRNVRTVADATNNGYSVLPWLKMASDSNFVRTGMDQILAYAWANMLLSWGPQPGNSQAVLELWTDSQSGRRINMPSFLYINLGTPVGDGPATDTALDTLLIGTSTYARKWTKGIVVVNPKEDSDPEASLTGYVDPTTCAPVNITSMAAHSYKILLLPGSCG